ncbi:hypothetical protein I7I50_05160 [Histoplasma capsulatum G186AR]|uniref:Uncharacterized protein n=1 Tax=Ajellomyces capsulatus TaxID=5037 RepID=A0A8H7ZBW9_AJECA|nr:hypothetical protein I7I52_03418 [Histoplasma capsulatum]QSS75877.1 hypothetical protein I7I50_05160 [Histoplasma capsulatum G186AR]
MVANVPKVFFVSLIRVDFVEIDKKPRLHQFIDLEYLFMPCKTSTSTGHSRVAIQKAPVYSLRERIATLV